LFKHSFSSKQHGLPASKYIMKYFNELKFLKGPCSNSEA